MENVVIPFVVLVKIVELPAIFVEENRLVVDETNGSEVIASFVPVPSTI